MNLHTPKLWGEGPGSGERIMGAKGFGRNRQQRRRGIPPHSFAHERTVATGHRIEHLPDGCLREPHTLDRAVGCRRRAT